MGQFGMSLLEAKRCTPADFEIYKLARRVKRQQEHETLALQAWFNQSVQATKKQGKKHIPKYKSFNEFYDSEEMFYSIFHPDYKKPKQNITLADLNRRINREGADHGRL